MPFLIKDIETYILDSFVTEVNFLSVSGEIGLEDYIGIFRFEAYLQNFSKVVDVEKISTPSPFGLVVNNDEDFIEIDISY